MESQCIHIEYKSENSWYHSVFTLNTKVKTHSITGSKNSWYHSVITLNTKVSILYKNLRKNVGGVLGLLQ
ncbi:hypothetical protein OUZ56_029864 [Daphnia magna]|uniref:Uncharacterized protein n=1 Tax=Daphnia magna TaxID=35525 RepID=A0ABR0B802_9CRUS|nr:hypothetical protein OUZ56_029864 [Daphnia magna]